MDWYVPNDTEVVRPLRLALGEHFERHAAEGSDVEGAVLAASELITNAIQNSDGPVWVSLDWGRMEPVLTVHDLGTGFTLDGVPEPANDQFDGRGLLIANHLVSELTVRAKRPGGSSVSAVLPVSRAPSIDIDLPASTMPSLPGPDEAGPGGTFGREPFMRALVVQLAQTMELVDGPGSADAMVAQVGTDVGGRMEDAFRLANQIDGELDLETMSRLFVELKAAIGGEFFVIEADSTKIVLGNTRCPFGEAVKRAPALCRMTSSVFGGIARRNLGAAAVDLEQRIAVGDPQCRVTVWLTPPGDDRGELVHHYGRFETPVDLSTRRP